MTISAGPHPPGCTGTGMSVAEREGAGSGSLCGESLSGGCCKPQPHQALSWRRAAGMLSKTHWLCPAASLSLAEKICSLQRVRTPSLNGDGNSWVRTGKYHEVQDLALAITGPRVNIWSYLSGVENCTILQRVWCTYFKKEEGGGVSTPSAARIGFDAKNKYNKSTNGTKCNRHPSVDNAQLIGQDTWVPPAGRRNRSPLSGLWKLFDSGKLVI